MHAGKGDLVRFVDDLASGRLTGAAPREYVVLLQEDVERDNESSRARRDQRECDALHAAL